MKTMILSYVIALGGVALIVFGIYSLVRERVAELGLKGYIPAIHCCWFGPDWPCADLAAIAPSLCRELL